MEKQKLANRGRGAAEGIITTDSALTHAEAIELLADSVVISTIDMGCSTVYRVSHPIHGNLILVMNVEGRQLALPTN